MRESSKIDKTKLPVDTYEGWLKTQRQPKRAERQKAHTIDAYDAWIGERVENMLRETEAKRKRVAG